MLFLEFWRMTLTFMMVSNMFLANLEQLLFSKHCSKKLYLEIAVKFSSQEHTRPPRIQEEKNGFDSRFPKSRLDLMGKQLQDQYLTCRKLRNGPQIMPFQPFLEGKLTQILYLCAVCGAWTQGHQIFFGTPQTCIETIGMVSRPGPHNTLLGRQIPGAY